MSLSALLILLTTKLEVNCLHNKEIANPYIVKATNLLKKVIHNNKL